MMGLKGLMSLMDLNRLNGIKVMTGLTCLAMIAVLGTGRAAAAGPDRIARIDRKLWPYPIADAAGFDFASRMEILVFVKCLHDAEPQLQGSALAPFLGLSKADEAGAAKWKDRAYAAMLANFRLAKEAKPSPLWGAGVKPPADLAALQKLAADADSAMPAELRPWRDAAKKFYGDYLYEQLRLAALFTKVSSEIFTYSPKEIQGDAYPDKSFLLTFDDGPTLPGGGTDILIAWLRQNHLNGTFFMLGGNLRHRMEKQSAADVQGAYAGMCTASHGLEHKSHAKWDQWRASISGTQSLLDSVFTENKGRIRYFRPPYGQRTAAAQPFLDSLGIKLMLWNLDSQDWNAKITAAQAADRITSLMLLWRHGILLFHDVHDKAISALPVVTKEVGGAVKWRGCAEE